jgi:hypothetical protein
MRPNEVTHFGCASDPLYKFAVTMTAEDIVAATENNYAMLML